jgi:hypothetical protein
VSRAIRRVPPVELSADPRFAGRVRRLAATAVVALGLIWALATTTLEAPTLVVVMLALGWVTMPTILVASLTRPRLRYALVVPSTLVGTGLLAISAAWLPANAIAAAGWLLITVGILLGGLLGLWFWFRVVPVPGRLDDPFSPGRMALIGIHVALIVAGLSLAVLGLIGP